MQRRIEFLVPSRPLAVVLTRTSWEELPRIRHQVTRQLCRWYNVLFVTSTQDWLGNLSFLRQKPSPRLINAGLMVARVGVNLLIPRRIAYRLPPYWLRSRGAVAREVLDLVEGINFPWAMLVNFDFDNVDIMKSRIFRIKIFICNDDFPAMLKNTYLRDSYLEVEGKVAKLADMVLAVAYPLLERLRRYNRNSYLLLPGHEFPKTANLNFKSRFKSEICACYMGYINRRILADWLWALIRYPGIQLTLIGPLQEKRFMSLLRHPEVTYIPCLEGAKLLEFLCNQDVFLIPFDWERPHVQAMSCPNKTFLYLAAGKPIVISDMPNFLKLPEGFLYRSRSAESFVELVLRAFREDTPRLQRRRIEYAMENTWDHRGEELQHHIHNLIENPRWKSRRSAMGSLL